MKINTTYWFALSCLLISFLTKGQAFSVAYADSLQNSGSLVEAATAWERVYFFSRNENEKISALFSRARCFKSLGQHYEAYKSLARVSNYELGDSLKCVANYELALNLYLSRYFNDAETFCAKNYNLPINSAEYKNSILLHGLVYNELNAYKKASQKLIEYAEQLPLTGTQKDSLKTLVNNYYSPKQLPKLKSLKKARRLSKCLPGAGLFYAGKPGKAFTNIGFQLFALGYTGANIYFANYVTSASAGLFMIRSFYFGGINQLNDIVPDLNYSRSRKFNDTFKSAFINQLKKYHAL